MGKYISQGRAAALACAYMLIAVEDLPRNSRSRGLHYEAQILEIFGDRVCKSAENLAEGKLTEFDYEGLFNELMKLSES